MTEQLIELGLAKREKYGSESKFGWLVDHLLCFISDIATDNPSLHSTEFRKQLNAHRKELIEATNELSVEQNAEQCLTLCQDFFKQARVFHFEREVELDELIKILRKALRELVEGSNNFNSRLMSTTERFSTISKVDDIRELKRQISEEVEEFKRIVAEKQRAEELAHSILSNRIVSLQENLSQAKQAAMQDSLTRVANRRSFDQELIKWLAECQAGRPAFGLAMIDIDNFKAINDEHGHPVGDGVIISAAQVLMRNVRGDDMVARYGGEEFAVLFNNVRAAQVEARVKSLIARISSTPHEYMANGQPCQVRYTASCGLAEYIPNDTAQEIIARADKALYEAKRGGKNRVIIRRRPFWGSLFSQNQTKAVDHQLPEDQKTSEKPVSS